jgi:pimeloyl-ACP methyl ester carboxylesterase
MSRYRSIALALCLVGWTVGLIAQGAKTPQVRTMPLANTQVEYVEAGKGAPVVFVHGAVGDLRFWGPQREAFAKSHRFVAYTMRYHGTKPWPDEGKEYSAETHASDLAAFITGFKAGPVHLVGLSYGGLVAALVATKEPQLIRTLTLAEPALFALLGESPDGKAALEAWMKGAAPVLAAVKSGDAMRGTRELLALVSGGTPEDFDKLPPETRQVLTDNARTLPVLFAAPPATISCDALRALKVPTLFVRGERTPVFFVKTNELAGRCIAGSRQAVVPAASHVMSTDNPAGFNRTVLEFIDQPAKSSSNQRLGN